MGVPRVLPVLPELQAASPETNLGYYTLFYQLLHRPILYYLQIISLISLKLIW